MVDWLFLPQKFWPVVSLRLASCLAPCLAPCLTPWTLKPRMLMGETGYETGNDTGSETRSLLVKLSLPDIVGILVNSRSNVFDSSPT